MFGDEVKSVSVMEGDSVTLHTNDPDIQKDDQIMWKFGHNSILIAQINRKNNNSIRCYDDKAGGRFRGRLKLDQTGSLIITNTRTPQTLDFINYRSAAEQRHRSTHSVLLSMVSRGLLTFLYCIVK